MKLKNTEIQKSTDGITSMCNVKAKVIPRVLLYLIKIISEVDSLEYNYGKQYRSELQKTAILGTEHTLRERERRTQHLMSFQMYCQEAVT
jgi:hypothetical protein